MVLLGGFTVMVRRRGILTDGNFIIWSGGGAFLLGRVISHFDFCGEMIFLFGRGEGHFWVRGICFSFLWVGSPLLGENKAFMAEPSDRPAINDGTAKRLNG